jgi:hypothetical protein
MNSLPLCAAAHPTDGLQRKFRIATFNVCTLNDESKSTAKMEELILRMQQRNIDICSLTEVRWPDLGIRFIKGWTMAF